MQFEPGWRHKRRWRRIRQLEGSAASAKSYRSDPSERLQGQEREEKVRQALGFLSAEECELVTRLYGLHGWPEAEAEIARRAGTSRQAIYNRKRRALDK